MAEVRFNSVFDIIGPVMVGPSSSHTAGAARIGRVARNIFGEQPEKVTIYLYGSFAKTYHGHGTDMALVGGILGMEPDDVDLRNSLKIAYEKGIKVGFVPKTDQTEHPNTTKIVLKKGERQLTVVGESIGGGNIRIVEIDGFKVSLSMSHPTYVIIQNDVPGVVASVTDLLNREHINISTMTVRRNGKGSQAMMIIEVDEIRHSIETELKDLPNILSARYFE